ncbi:MAG TPA: hypothetical protein PKZ83_17395 [bacterium]|nr:hypothetical protein [bacterium]HQJ66277.1 hypothetical protein [bacterium]
MKALIENRWVEFFIGCGIILLAYTGSPRTMVEVFIAVGGTSLGAILLILSWNRDQDQANSHRRSSKA